jgi:hypothetical protein
MSAALSGGPALGSHGGRHSRRRSRGRRGRGSHLLDDRFLGLRRCRLHRASGADGALRSGLGRLRSGLGHDLGDLAISRLGLLDHANKAVDLVVLGRAAEDKAKSFLGLERGDKPPGLADAAAFDQLLSRANQLGERRELLCVCCCFHAVLFFHVSGF